jgi:hypothetical protein
MIGIASFALVLLSSSRVAQATTFIHAAWNSKSRITTVRLLAEQIQLVIVCRMGPSIDWGIMIRAI